jgi:hypothetical protein
MNHRIICGGNRAGKTTYGRSEAAKHYRPHIIGADGLHRDSVMCMPSATIVPACSVEALSKDDNFRGRFLWIDERFNTMHLLHELVRRFDASIWTVWADKDVMDTQHYKDCEAAGTIERWTMLPKLKEQLDRSDFEWSEKEYDQRVYGVFN